MTSRLFRRKANRFCVLFAGLGHVPVAQQADDKPIFVTTPPSRIGDDCVIRVEGRQRLARLLKSTGHYRDATYLVDMGAYPRGLK